MNKWVTGIAIAVLMSGAAACTAAETGAEGSTSSASPRTDQTCKGGSYDWLGVSQEWRVVALSALGEVEAEGGTFGPPAEPYHPRTAKATGTGAAGLTEAAVVKALGKDVKKPLAEPGTSTTETGWSMSKEFDGAAMAAVYRGVLVIEADYRYSCGGSSAQGRVISWDTDSSSGGAINCLEKPDGGRDTSFRELEKQAVTELCPEDSAARAA
jgi:hypothetical protein